MPRGGKRPNAGRPSLGKREITLWLREASVSKIDRLRRHRKLSRGEFIDEWASGITVPGLEYLELCPVVKVKSRGNSRGCPRVAE